MTNIRATRVHAQFIYHTYLVGMNRIDELTIDKVRDAAGIVDVVSDFVTLRRRGKEYEGLCPFHADRNLGSFKVAPAKNICTCFSCAKTWDPVGFVMEAEGLTFPDAIRWLAQKYGIFIDDEQDRFKPTPSQPKKELPIPPDLPPRLWNIDMVKARLDTSSDLFVSWVHSLGWTLEQRKHIDTVLHRFLVGHSAVISNRNGNIERHDFTLFWQIDHKMRVHNGHLMKYHANGHRVKEKEQYPQTWIHARMQYADPSKTGILPFNKYAERPSFCLFGLHQLAIPGTEEMTVNIVESEKTAILASIAWCKSKKHVWMACCGLQNLMNRNDMLRPLIKQNRRIVLYPDRDGVEQWREAVKKINYEHLDINTDFVEKYWMECDGEKADVADVMLRMIQHPETVGRKPTPKLPERIDKVIHENPFVNELIEGLDLIEDT